MYSYNLSLRYRTYNTIIYTHSILNVGRAAHVCSKGAAWVHLPAIFVPVETLDLQQPVVVAITERAHLYSERLPCWIQCVLDDFSFVYNRESKTGAQHVMNH